MIFLRILLISISLCNTINDFLTKLTDCQKKFIELHKHVLLCSWIDCQSPRFEKGSWRLGQLANQSWRPSAACSRNRKDRGFDERAGDAKRFAALQGLTGTDKE